MTNSRLHIDFTENSIKVGRRYVRKDENGEPIQTLEERFWEMTLWIASAELTKEERQAWEGLENLQRLYDEESDNTGFSQTVINFVIYVDKFWEELIQPLLFLPNSPTIVNSGNTQGSLSACYVRSPKDTMEDIFQCQKDWGLIEKYGGGIGGFFGLLRERNSTISTTHGKALGPLAVMRRFAYWSCGTENDPGVTQGSFREGAHMAQLQYTHPDILEFIHCKDNSLERTDILSNFNISIQVSDLFMDAVLNENWDLPVPLISPKDNSIVKDLTVGQIWNELCESAWKTGDPGIVFIDRVNETKPNLNMEILSSNPCGEEFLEEFGSCNLGSIDLSKHIKKSSLTTGYSSDRKDNWLSTYEIDWGKLRNTIKLAVRFLDNTITVNNLPESVPQLREVNLLTRRIGLGVMGWNDLLSYLNIPYASQEAVDLAQELSRFITQSALLESGNLGKEKGNFESFIGSKWEKEGWTHMRNSSVTTIAPTGSISILAGCNGGIEPYFDYVWKRQALWENQKGTIELLECPKVLIQQLKETNHSEEDIQEFLKELEELKSLDEEEVRYLYNHFGDTHGINLILFLPSHKINYDWHIKHLGSWQYGITNSVSKTINMKNECTVGDIKDAFIQAYESGCKDITVYRDGSKEQVLNSSSNYTTLEKVLQESTEKESGTIEFWIDVEKQENLNRFHIYQDKLKRPSILEGSTHKIQTGHGNLYVTVNVDEDGKPFEVFANMGKAGSCHSAHMEAITRLISGWFRSHGELDTIIEELRNITCCPIHSKDAGSRMILSPADAISYVLAKYSDTYKNEILLSEEIQDLQKGDSIFSKSSDFPRHTQSSSNIICPKCSGETYRYEGCIYCKDTIVCQWSKC